MLYTCMYTALIFNMPCYMYLSVLIKLMSGSSLKYNPVLIKPSDKGDSCMSVVVKSV